MKLAASLFISVLVAVAFVSQANAVSLKVTPVEYRTTLKKNQAKKAFIDISNPTGETLTIKTSVQAFRQVDDNGGLKFYDDEFVSKGIKVGLKSFRLKAREAARMYFSVDGAKLPSGDVYAAIFFKTSLAVPKNGIGQQVQVGTLLSVTNGTPGKRQANVVDVSLSPIQFGDTIQGDYQIANTAPKGSGTGFYPDVSIDVWPGSEQQQQGSLIFPGITRTNPFTYKGAFPGFHRVSVGYDGQYINRWVLIAPMWLYLLVGFIGFVIVMEVLLYKRRKWKHKRNKK